MVRRKGSTNSLASVVQEWAATNIDQGGDLVTKMDRILGVIQGCEGKANATVELMLDMKKRFEEKLEALREENGEIKARLYDKRDDSEKEKSPEKSEEERSHHKGQKDKGQSSKGIYQETK